MAANTQPIFSIAGDVQWTNTGAMTVANTTKDLTAGTSYLAYTSPSEGGFVQRIRFRALGTNSNATVARVWINNGDVTTTAANNTLFDEITLTATLISEVGALATFELPLNFALPATYRIYITLGTAPTSAGWQATVIAGKY